MSAEQSCDSLTQDAQFIARISVIVLQWHSWLGQLIIFPTTPMH
jgi:hypothetical protein